MNHDLIPASLENEPVVAAQRQTSADVLMLAYHFPPSNAAGVFRPLRFAKYLPDFGWRPIFLCVALPDGNSSGDLSLVDQIPSETIVQRTSIRFPDDVVDGWLHRASQQKPEDSSGQANRETSSQGPAGISGSSVEERTGSPEDESPSVNPEGESSESIGRLRQVVRNAWDTLLMTPDRQVWWMRPAIRSAMSLVREHQPKVLFSTGPPHSTHLIAARIKRRTGLPWIADFRDPWARKPWGPGRRNPWGQRLAPWFERYCVRRADQVILNTHRLREDFVTTYPNEPREKFVTLTNGYDPDVLTKIEPLLEEAPPSSPSAPIRLCHPGTLYGRRDPRNILAAIARLRDEGILVQFDQFGRCAPQFQVEKFVREHQLEGLFTLHGRTSHDSILRHMARSQLLLIVQPDTALQVPGKLFEMLLFKKPIVALACDGETADIVKRQRLGTVASPDKVEQIAQAIKEAIAMRAVDETRWKETLESYDGRSLSRDLGRLLEGQIR